MPNEAYDEKLREQIRRWQQKKDDLQSRLKQAGSGERRRLEQRVEDLEAKRTAARRKLDHLTRRASGTPRGRYASAVRRLGRAVMRMIPGL